MSRFDKEIKDKLEGYGSSVNSDMWDKISSNLPPQEQTDPKTWWLPIVGVTIVAIGAFALFLSSDFDLKGSSIQSSISQNHQTESTEESDIAQRNELSGNIEVGEDNLDNTSISIISKNENKNNNSNNSNLINSDYSGKNNTSNANQNSVNFQNQNINDAAKDLTLASNDINSTTQKAIDADETSMTEATGSLYKQYNAIINKTRELKAASSDMIVERSEEIFVAPLRIEDMKVTSLETTKRFSLPKEKLICPSFSDLRFGVFAEAFYSNDFAMRALSYNGPVGDVDYLNIRNNTEHSNYSFSAGARISFMLPSGLGAKTGINYSQINETFKYEDPDSRQTKMITIKEYQWENGVVVDSTEVTKTIDIPGKLTVVNQNKYKIIDLPLLFTYEWGHKKRLYYSVTAGPMFNIKFTQRGKFLEPEALNPVDFSSDRGTYKAFSTNVGTSMFMSFSLNYQLGNGMDVFVEPNVRYFLNNVTTSSYLLNQKYTVLGLGFGVKYKL